jgi:hypothetical protein
VGQVCRLERVVRRGGEETREVALAITSAGPERASAEELLDFWRGHWGIENRSHWVRDVTLGEDASRIRTGNAPQVMAGLRNAAIEFLRLEEASNIAAALRENLYHIPELLSKLGALNLCVTLGVQRDCLHFRARLFVGPGVPCMEATVRACNRRRA